ncbi:MAG: hypothetical protein Q8Q09_18770 [Deltaproteobacteria bacterium]|nr:hypothetical protein [Deltaproteobacteria bacterium]
MTTIVRTAMQVQVRETATRVTPQPAGRQFAAALAQGGQALIRVAMTAAAHVPGVDLAAAALRGAGVGDGAAVPSTGVASLGGSNTASAGSAVGASAEGPAVGGGGTGGSGGTGGAGGAGAGGDGDLLARGQEMSMRMLRLQESMAEENRRYTALSNVMHARHEMAKNAIGNIR